MTAEMVVSNYVKLDHREHIIKRSDTYVGSLELEEISTFIARPDDQEGWEITYETVSIVPALLKIFDEIITNASDHVKRTEKVTTIKCNITDDGAITIYNDGPGIPVEKHPDYGVYVPEFLFGDLLSGSNFDDTEARYGGGRNGYGAKLCNIFSQWFKVETADGKKVFRGGWHNNMETMDPIEVKRSTKKYTSISFLPDWSLLGLDKLDDNHLFLFVRRLFDIAAFTGVKVYFNDKVLPCSNFEQYVKLLTQDDPQVINGELNSNWQWAITSTNDSNNLDQYSLVNGIVTYKGGEHVKEVLNLLCEEILKLLHKKSSWSKKLKVNDIKNRINLFLNCQIINPTFDSQTKVRLTTKAKNLDLPDKVSPKVIKTLKESALLRDLIAWVQEKEEQEEARNLKKLANSSRQRCKLRIPKLEDANLAGKAGKSHKCTIILVEGDSAASSVVAGLSEVGRDYYGVYPLRGKLTNVRDMDSEKILKSAVISDLVNAIGLNPGRDHKLRYGKIILMTDSDDDGNHIKGLLLNFFHYLSPEILISDMIYEFVTPVVIAHNKKDKLEFFSYQDYKNWREQNKTKDWKIKYYKGLGTFKPDDIKPYFRTIENYIRRIKYLPEDDEIINLALDKSRADDRKEWLNNLTSN